MTPRTDAFIKSQEAEGISIWAALLNIQEHARTLEREVSVLRAALEKCREEFCWHGNTGMMLTPNGYGELVEMVDKALNQTQGEG